MFNYKLGRLSNTAVFEPRRQLEVDFLYSSAVIWNKFLGKLSL